jgi:probable FeS assembly SUF system protein SufT
MNEYIQLKRETAAIAIPSGTASILPAGTGVSVMQFLGSSWTVTSAHGMFRIDLTDADALGLQPPAAANSTDEAGQFSEKLVWDQLKTIFDPEIPVNIADLGLIYACDIKPLEQGGNRIEIKMSMTAPGCGMGNVLKMDVESKLAKLPDVKEVEVEIVFEPQWGPSRMSEAAKLQLGFDL